MNRLLRRFLWLNLVMMVTYCFMILFKYGDTRGLVLMAFVFIGYKVYRRYEDQIINRR